MFMRDEPCPHELTYLYGILYLGINCNLVIILKRELKELDCYISYVPLTSMAHTFIKSDNKLHLFLFDEQTREATGAELMAFARTVPHRARTPCIIVPTDATPDNSSHLVEQIKRLLAPGG